MTMYPSFVRSIWLFVVISFVSSDIIVNTKYGDIRGTRTDKALQFLGIPYAKPPVGDLRWVAPQEPASWKPDIYNATQNSPGCPQIDCQAFLPPGICPDKTSEDCLYLNVWSPLDSNRTSNYPVMVFIHGGGFTYGFMESLLYDGTNLVACGKVVFVGIAYRLGILGFLYTGNTGSDIQGNYGIKDQRLALTWVRDNIKEFGGNPDQVTVFGQSAGAQSIAVHLASRLSDNLFHAAIIQSSPFAVPFRSKKDAISLAGVISKSLGCDADDIGCIRSKTTAQLLEAQQASLRRFTTTNLLEYTEPIGPVVDGTEVKQQTFESALRGEMQNIPVVIGSVSEEFRLFLYEAISSPMSRLEYQAAIAVLHPTHFIDIEFKYPPPQNTSDYRETLSQVLTDYLFTCAGRNVSLNMINNGNKNVYRYVFDHATNSKGSWGNFTFCEGHVCHSEELSYIFGNSRGNNVTTGEIYLHQSMLSYWTDFAHSGKPNTGARNVSMPWPTYDRYFPTTMHFSTPIFGSIDDYRGEFCDFWDSIGY